MNLIQRWRITRTLRRQFYNMDAQALRQHQAAALDQTLAFIQQHSAYYRERYPNPVRLDEIAPINKATMMEHFNAINSADLDRDTLVQFRIETEKAGSLGLYCGQYSVGLSSGTTGSRLLTVLSTEERQLYSCLLWARSGIPENVKPRRVLFALRTNNPAFTEIGAFGVKLVYVDYTRPVEALIQLINQKRLNILAGPPSLLLMLARQSRLIDHPIDTLVSYAEVLEEPVQRQIQGAFQTPVVQIYQGAEGFLGTTCRDGRLHLNEDVLLIEPLADPTLGPTRVLVTDLYRRTQPLIRFQLDDVLELGNSPCTCGSMFRTIQRIHGRSDEVLVLLDAAGQPRYLFPDYVRRAINQASDRILEYQAIQHAPDQLEIRLLLKDERERAQIEQAVLQNLAWRVEKIGASLGRVAFTTDVPERNPQSKKLVRVTRRFPWTI